MSQPAIPPPTSSLPQLPISKLRGPSPLQSPAISKFALRTPSKIVKPPAIGSHAVSSPNVPTLRSNSANKTHHQVEGSSVDQEIRRSVSIANFPQPPKVRRVGLDSKHSTNTTISPSVSETSAINADDGAPHNGSSRLKLVKPNVSSDAQNQIHGAESIPSLLNGSGNGKAIASGPVTRRSKGLPSPPSPPHSRNPSTQGSYSTSATTFEDMDDKKAKGNGLLHQNREGSQRRDSGRKESEGKGNVIVSVRIRPDAGGDKTSGKDWMVDSRQSLVAYRGREGGDYYYGKHLDTGSTHVHFPHSPPKAFTRYTAYYPHSYISLPLYAGKPLC